jgi:hypothetical protein
LKTEWLKQKIMLQDQFQAIQEIIARFLREQVRNPNGEFYHNTNETLIPNKDDHLYAL